jgi:hypothetical protein
MNNMGREIMAALKRFQVGSDGDGVTVGGALVVSGATTLTTVSATVVQSDTVSEKTSAAGVTIDGVLLKDNGVVTGAGTVSAPVYSTTGDTNTGIFFPAADTIAFAEGGAEAMRIDSSGRVGIGTDSPAPFVGNGTTLQLSGGVTTTELRLTRGDGSDVSILAGSSTAGGVFQTNNSTPLRFGTSNTERMRIDSSGNVGIGTTSPNTLLNLSNSTGPVLRLTNTDTTLETGNSIGAVEFEGKDASTNAAGVTASINTEIQGFSGATDLLFKTGTALTLAEQYRIKFDGIHIWSTLATERMRIDSSGVVGIGTSSPVGRLEVVNTSAGASAIALRLVNGSATSNTETVLQFQPNVGGSERCAQISGKFDGGTNATALLFYTNANGAVPTERARITSGGNFLVGTTSNPSGFKTLIDGTLSATGSVSFPQSNNDTTANAANMNIQADGYLRRSTSALKYKQDIRDLESINVNTFRPVRYKSKCNGDDQTKDHFGLIADEVDAAGIRELVTYGADGEVEGFQYERLTVVLVKAIQELKAELDTVKAELATLKGN